MPLSPADLSLLSRLLDQALELPPGEVEAWLASLPPEHQAHVPALRAMLAQHSSTRGEAFLASTPSLATDDAVAQAGERVGPYRLLREIGRGGMGSVWLAERADGAFERQVALKLPRLAWDEGLAGRMAREREIGARLEHPAIARLYDAGVDERGRPYLALEYIEGQPIDAWCEAQQLDVPARLRLFVQVARAVAYAHGRLIVHRDLKPSNVLVSADGQAHLLDFGIAKLLHQTGDGALTQEQGRALTPHYASPEQLAGETITVQSDVYSLGVLLYELLTGTLPHQGRRNTAGAIEEAILQGDAPPASSRAKVKATARALRGEVDAILGMALQREPGRRYATADALAQDIERHLAGETVSARPDSVGYRLRKALRRHWLGVGAATVVLLAVLGGSAVAVVQANRAARAAERERMVKQFVADVFRVNGRVDRGNATRPRSAQGLLEEGARLIEHRFGGQPDVQAALYGVVGGVFADMGAHQLAADFSSRQLDALVKSSADVDEQAATLLRLAQALIEDESYKDAAVRARRAMEMAPQDQRLQLDGLVLLARAQIGQARRNDAEATVGEIKRRLSLMGPEAPLSTQSWVYGLEAQFARADESTPDKALASLDKAIQLALLAEGPLSGSAITMRMRAALWLVRSPEPERSRPYFDAAVDALRQLGGAHAIRAPLVSAIYAFVKTTGGSHGTFSEAIAELERCVSELSMADIPVPDWFIAQIKVWIGDLTVDAGNVEAGLKLLEAHGPTLRRFRNNPRDRQLLGEEMGGALKFAGRHQAAQLWYTEKLEAVQEIFPNTRGVVVAALADLFLNFVYWGRLDEANAVLQKASQGVARQDAGEKPTWEWQVLHAMRARLHLERGQYAEALRLIQEDGTVTSSFVEGEALCRAGQPAKGLLLLRSALEREGGSDEFVDHARPQGPDPFPHSPWTARRRAVAGLCAFAAGEAAAASRFAALGRADFVAQPNVSPYFKAPLIELERKLGLRLPPP